MFPLASPLRTDSRDHLHILEQDAYDFSIHYSWISASTSFPGRISGSCSRGHVSADGVGTGSDSLSGRRHANEESIPFLVLVGRHGTASGERRVQDLEPCDPSHVDETPIRQPLGSTLPADLIDEHLFHAIDRSIVMRLCNARQTLIGEFNQTPSFDGRIDLLVNRFRPSWPHAARSSIRAKFRNAIPPMTAVFLLPRFRPPLVRTAGPEVGS